jgi:hypothetical protein
MMGFLGFNYFDFDARSFGKKFIQIIKHHFQKIWIEAKKKLLLYGQES